jgi:hypothetical protein
VCTLCHSAARLHVIRSWALALRSSRHVGPWWWGSRRGEVGALARGGLLGGGPFVIIVIVVLVIFFFLVRRHQLRVLEAVLLQE